MLWQSGDSATAGLQSVTAFGLCQPDSQNLIEFVAFWDCYVVESPRDAAYMRCKPEMSLGKKKKRRDLRSPAACLLPQFEDNMRRSGRGRRGAEYASDDESPGKLFTYVSAGNIELPGDNEARPVFVRSRRPVFLMAVLLVLIWVLF